MNHDELKLRMAERGIGADVQARILRLNPEPIDPGVKLRGYRPGGRAADLRLFRDVFTKGEVIRRFGRENYRRIPDRFRVRDGRREYVHRVAVLNEVWRDA